MTTVNTTYRSREGATQNFTFPVEKPLKKSPELFFLCVDSDHLGNVRAVVSKDGDNLEMVSISDFYTFGMEIPGRLKVPSEGQYRFDYQGQFAEKDEETGYNAFDAREYDSRIGRWLTTDQAREFFSPYIAMGNNPVLFCDPDGRKIKIRYRDASGKRQVYIYKPNITPDIDNEFVQQTVEALNHIYKSKTAQSMIDDFVYNDGFIFKKNVNIYETYLYYVHHSGGKIYWNTNMGAQYMDNNGNLINGYSSPAIVLGHELAHTWIYKFYNDYYFVSKNFTLPFYGSLHEFCVISIENLIVLDLGESFGQIRQNHYSRVFTTYGPTSIKSRDLMWGRSFGKIIINIAINIPKMNTCPAY